MKKYAVPILVAVIAVLGVAIVVQAAYLARLERKISQIEKDIKKSDETPVAAGKTVDRLEERVEKLEKTTASSPRKEVLPRPDGGDPLDDLGTSPNLPPAMAEEIEQMIQARVAEEVKKQKPEGKKKPPLTEVAEDLNVDGITEGKMADVINVGKDEAFELLKIPREDGTSFVDDVIAIIQSGKNMEQEGGKIFQRLLTEKVPGTDETYFQGIMKIQQRVNDNLQNILNPDQFESYQHMGLDPMDIQTGHDPWAKYVEENGIDVPGGQDD